MEPCQRCGKIGHDRRTLFMACFYAMNELGLPFSEVRLHGSLSQKTGEKQISIGPGPNFSVSEFADPDPKSQRDRDFFTLRVCKQCRADWMNAIKDWFWDADPHESTESDIFVCENGEVIIVAQDET